MSKKMSKKQAFKKDLKSRTMRVSEVINFLKQFDGNAPFFGGNAWAVNMFESTGYANDDDGERRVEVKGVDIKRFL
jgi:hypothetical protein